MKTNSIQCGRLGHLALIGALALAGGSAAHAQRVARDADGALRAPTAEEGKALEAAPATKASRPVGMLTGRVNPPAVQRADGSIEQELDSSTVMYSVARRNADGKLEMFCLPAEQANKMVKGQKVTAVTGKEHQHAK